jgi:molecular chaperone DnaJ
LVLRFRSNNDAAASGGGESHENEGFLKSLWHNITNHPAYQKKPDEPTSTGDKKPEDKTSEKSENEKKTGSGSG